MTTTSDLARLLMMQGTRLPDAGLGPVSPASRAGRTDSIAPTQETQRPNDYMAPVAELLSLPMGAFGAGQLVGSGINAAREGDYASGAGQVALGMAGMLPMPKIKAFHASQAEFDKFKPSNYRGATYLASTPEDARRGAGAGAREYVMNTASEVPNEPWHIYEAEIDPSKVEGLALSPKQNEFFNQLPENITLNEYNTKWRQLIEKEFGTVPPWLYDESTIAMPDGRTFTSDQLSKLSDAEFQDVVGRGFETLRRGDVPRLSYEDAVKTNRDIFGRQFSHYSPTGDEAKAAQRVLGSGMGAYLLQDEGGLSIAVADPSIANIVSRNGQPIPQGIRAFHGSPHDFDRFDMSKIGTGEGAQAYGHGLYFAEAEDVARSYRDALRGKAGFTGPEKTAQEFIGKHGGDVERARKDLNQQLLNPNIAGEHRADLEAARDLLYEGYNKSAGHMYEVNIRANPEDFLDWDKRLRDQPEAIQEAMARIDDPMFRTWQENGAWPHNSGQTLYRHLADGLTRKAHDGGRHVTATQALREAGIPGIRYLDQMSRGAGEGSSNYVVFDDNLIEILRKYGLLGPVAGGGTLAGMLMGGQDGETY